MPALLISTSIGPSSRSTPATMPFTAAACETSAPTAIARPPCLWIASTTAFASAAFVR